MNRLKSFAVLILGAMCISLAPSQAQASTPQYGYSLYNLHTGWNENVKDANAQSLQFEYPRDLKAEMPISWSGTLNGLGLRSTFSRNNHVILMVGWHKGAYKTASKTYASLTDYFNDRYDVTSSTPATYAGFSGKMYTTSVTLGFQDGTEDTSGENIFVFTTSQGYEIYVESISTDLFHGPTADEWERILLSLRLTSNDFPAGQMLNPNTPVVTEPVVTPPPGNGFNVPTVSVPVSHTTDWLHYTVQPSSDVSLSFDFPTNSTKTGPIIFSTDATQGDEVRFGIKGFSGEDFYLRWAKTDAGARAVLDPVFSDSFGAQVRYGNVLGTHVNAFVVPDPINDPNTGRSLVAFAFAAKGYSFAISMALQNSLSYEDWGHIMGSINLVQSEQHNDIAIPLPPVHNVASDLENGVLIKAEGNATVYRVQDGKRQPFLNEELFRMWYKNFDGLKTVSASDMGAIPLAAAVLPPQGTWIKIDSVPEVYEVDVDGKTLHWVSTEDVARRLRGDSWNKNIKPIDVTLYQHFAIGTPITQ